MMKGKHSIFNRWLFWIIVIVLMAAIGFGVSYLSQSPSDYSRKSEKKDKNDNPFIGTWYLPYDNDVMVLEFSKNGKCNISYGDLEFNCSYEYDDTEITIINETNTSLDPIIGEYVVGSNYIKLDGEKMYDTKSRAKRDIDNNINKSYKVYSNSKDDNTIGVDEAFIFDGFELEVGSNYRIDTFGDDYGTYSGKNVLILPVTIKNIGNEEKGLNYFYYTYYCPKDTMLQNFGLFYANEVGLGGELAPGETANRYMYIEFVGPDDYIIKFDNYVEDEIILSFTIE